MDILWYGDAAWSDGDAARRVASLAARGHRVLYVEPAPPHAPRGARAATPDGVHVAPRTACAAAARRLALRDPVVVAGAGDTLDRRAFPHRAHVLVLHADDASSHDAWWREARALRDADVVLAATPSLLARCAAVNANACALPDADDAATLEHHLDAAHREAESRRLRPIAESCGALHTAASPPPPEMTGASRVQRAWRAAARATGRVYHAARVAARALAGRPARVRRILVARGQCRLGDLVAIAPTLAALRRLHPDARIVLGAPAGLAPLVLGHGATIDAVEPLDFLQRPTLAGRALGALRLWARGYDLVVSGAAYFVTVEPFLSGAPLHVGIDDGHPLQRLNDLVLPLDPSRHEAENNLRLVEGLGVRLERAARVPAVTADATRARSSADAVLAAHAVPVAAPLLTLHAGAQKPSRRWPAERFAAVAERLLGERATLHVALTGGAAEREDAEAIRAAVPSPLRDRMHVVAGETDLHGLVGLLDRSAAVVCNDTGVLHLARARGAPLVALLGPENDLRWGPHPDGRGRAIALRHVVPCAPCSRWSCDVHVCLRRLDASDVARHVDALLGDASLGDDRSATERRTPPTAPSSRHCSASAARTTGWSSPTRASRCRSSACSCCRPTDAPTTTIGVRCSTSTACSRRSRASAIPPWRRSSCDATIRRPMPMRTARATP